MVGTGYGKFPYPKENYNAPSSRVKCFFVFSLDDRGFWERERLISRPLALNHTRFMGFAFRSREQRAWSKEYSEKRYSLLVIR
jgi:hypothetical protein